jgi:hypothetical protein
MLQMLRDFACFLFGATPYQGGEQFHSILP